MINSGVRLIILLLSLYGFLQEIASRIKVEFAFGILFASIGSSMFFAGILNILPEMAAAICILGLWFAFRSFRRMDSIRNVLNSGTVFFIMACVGFALLLHRSIFTHYDNFSHWALATKVLLEKDRFPNYTDINIMFQSYPLGYASFIYYITKILDIRTEWIQMFAQSMFMCGVLTSLVAFTKNWQQKLLAAVGCFFLLAGNTNFTDLLVDTLLPVTAIGAIAFCIYYRDSLFEKVWWVLPYSVYLVTIKNSGMFFSLVILAYLMCLVRSRKDGAKCLLQAAASFGTLLLWQKHVDLVFDDGMMSYHSMSIDYFEKTLDGKNQEDIASIFRAFTEEMISFSNPVLFVAGILILAYILHSLGVKRKMTGTVILVFAAYLSYQVMMFGMYLLTMPRREALQLAEYARYHDTILIFVAGIALIAVLQGMDLNEKWHIRGIAALMTMACLYFGVTPVLSYYTRQDPNADVRGMFRLQYEALIEEYNIQPNCRYALLIRADPNSFYTGFLKYVTRYLLDPKAVTIEAVDEFNMEETASQYDYLIVFDTTEDVVSYMSENYPGQASQRVIRLPGK